MRTISAAIIPNKYEYIKTLGQGKDNVTYLVRHKQLGIFLAMKTLSECSSGPAQLYQELTLMKSLNHPGIPKIIDVIQKENLYVVQEFIPGASLGEFLSCNISLQQFLSVSGQLISIINYLHNQGKDPVLYLDFKPEHIRICGTQVYLLDYGMASHCENGKVNNLYYGTEEYSAPEVKKYHYATVQSDVFSLGKIMEMMMRYTIAKSYCEKVKMQQVQNIIRCCTKEEEELRYKNVKEVLSELRRADRRWQKSLQIEQLHQQSTIAVIGTHHGVGTTHIAAGIAYCLNMSGMEGIYVEQTANQWLRQSSIIDNEKMEERKKITDLIRKGRFVGLPAYGPYYEPVLPKQGIFVRDLGVLWDGFCPEAYDRVLIVLGCRYWEEELSLQYIKRFCGEKNCIFICSLGELHRVHYLAKKSGECIYSWGYDKDLFHISREKLRIINRMLRKEEDA